MSWKVGVVADQKISNKRIGDLLRQMPVWALTTSDRKVGLKELLSSAGEIWDPEPAVTLYACGEPEDTLADFLSEVGTLEMHHPHLVAISVFGLDPSVRLCQGLAEYGYLHREQSEDEGLLFTKALGQLSDVTTISLDALGWTQEEDFYRAFLIAVGGPEWHGHNFNALRDSIGTGGINRIEVPYRIVVHGTNGVAGNISCLLASFSDLIQDLERRGCPVEISFSDTLR